jgi:hypothetical protein
MKIYSCKLNLATTVRCLPARFAPRPSASTFVSRERRVGKRLQAEGNYPFNLKQYTIFNKGRFSERAVSGEVPPALDEGLQYQLFKD